MQYNFDGNAFLGRRFGDEGESDPMSGLANLADVMLVFACGLMMALVVYWNLDLPNIRELDESQMQQVEDIEEMVDNINSTTNPYMELGKVYQDPATGKLYMLTEAEDASDGSSASGDGATSEGADGTQGTQSTQSTQGGASGASAAASGASASSQGAEE